LKRSGTVPTAIYMTRQREALVAYLRSQAGEHVSAEQIVEHFAAMGMPIGRATVYRHLGRLERDGIVQRYTTDARGASCFQYLDAETEAHEHFHLKCERCGTLQHVECPTLDGMGQHIRESHAFRLNPLKTVLYGTCHDCMKTDQKGSNR
jgi:Fur family ferric uptake transcriptional regulator